MIIPESFIEGIMQAFLVLGGIIAVFGIVVVIMAVFSDDINEVL